MPKSRITSLTDFIPHKDDVITLDSNILIKLLYPAMCENAAISAYEALYATILKVKCRLIISSVQISEFINRCIRFQFELYKKSSGDVSLDFKRDYRSTDDYKNSMNAILDIIKSDIMPNYAFIDDGFKDMQSDKIFRYGFSYDFNDSILVEIASRNNAIIVTDDADFGNYDSPVKLVSNNRKLLMFR